MDFFEDENYVFDINVDERTTARLAALSKRADLGYTQLKLDEEYFNREF